MRLAALALVMTLAAAGPGWAAASQYSGFPGEAVSSGRAALPILDTPDAKTYSTRLREGVSHPPNFSGH